MTWGYGCEFATNPFKYLEIFTVGSGLLPLVYFFEL